MFSWLVVSRDSIRRRLKAKPNSLLANAVLVCKDSDAVCGIYSNGMSRVPSQALCTQLHGAYSCSVIRRAFVVWQRREHAGNSGCIRKHADPQLVGKGCLLSLVAYTHPHKLVLLGGLGLGLGLGGQQQKRVLGVVRAMNSQPHSRVRIDAGNARKGSVDILMGDLKEQQLCHGKQQVLQHIPMVSCVGLESGRRCLVIGSESVHGGLRRSKKSRKQHVSHEQLKGYHMAIFVCYPC